MANESISDENKTEGRVSFLRTVGNGVRKGWFRYKKSTVAIISSLLLVAGAAIMTTWALIPTGSNPETLRIMFLPSAYVDRVYPDKSRPGNEENVAVGDDYKTRGPGQGYERASQLSGWLNSIPKEDREKFIFPYSDAEVVISAGGSQASDVVTNGQFTTSQVPSQALDKYPNVEYIVQSKRDALNFDPVVSNTNPAPRAEQNYARDIAEQNAAKSPLNWEAGWYPGTMYELVQRSAEHDVPIGTKGVAKDWGQLSTKASDIYGTNRVTSALSWKADSNDLNAIDSTNEDPQTAVRYAETEFWADSGNPELSSYGETVNTSGTADRVSNKSLKRDDQYKLSVSHSRGQIIAGHDEDWSVEVNDILGKAYGTPLWVTSSARQKFVDKIHDGNWTLFSTEAQALYDAVEANGTYEGETAKATPGSTEGKYVILPPRTKDGSKWIKVDGTPAASISEARQPNDWGFYGNHTDWTEMKNLSHKYFVPIMIAQSPNSLPGYTSGVEWAYMLFSQVGDVFEQGKNVIVNDLIIDPAQGDVVEGVHPKNYAVDSSKISGYTKKPAKAIADGKGFFSMYFSGFRSQAGGDMNKVFNKTTTVGISRKNANDGMIVNKSLPFGHKKGLQNLFTYLNIAQQYYPYESSSGVDQSDYEAKRAEWEGQLDTAAQSFATRAGITKADAKGDIVLAKKILVIPFWSDIAISPIEGEIS